MASRDWRPLIRRRARAAGVDLPPDTIDELAVHLDDLYAAARRDGASDEAARAGALRALDESGFTPLEVHAARARQRGRAPDARDLAAMAASPTRSLMMLHALRMALRQFRRHRAFALVTMLVLGLGTGAAVAVYSIVNGVVLRPLPYRAPDRLVTIWETNASKGLAHERLSPVNFMDYRVLPAFADAAGWWRPDVDLADPGLDPVRVKAVETSVNLFDLLGVRPEIGPGFPASDTLWSRTAAIAVISDRLWRTRYAADPAMIGRQLRLSGSLFTVVGVMPARFNYPGDVDVWEGLQWDFTQHSRGAHFLEAVARLRPGVDLVQAQVQLQALSERLGAEHAATNRGWSTRVIPLLDDQLGYYRPALMVLFGAVGLLLLIGCLNVASLLLTRALSREREMAVRTALGASPRQLVAQLLAESLILSLGGAVLGVVATSLALPLIVRATPLAIPRLDEAAVDGRVLGFALSVVAATTMVFGLAPALVIGRRGLAADLRSAERGSSRGARRVYHVLVAGELALACALLVGSALLVRTVQRMTDVSTGVEAGTALMANIQLPASGYKDWPSVAQAYAAILDRVRGGTGIDAAGAGATLPVEPGWRLPFHLDGTPPPARPEEATQAQHHTISDGYVEALGARAIAGRLFSAHDTAASAPVVIVNQTFVRTFVQTNHPVGLRLHTTATTIGPLGRNLLAGQSFEIVGVVSDIRDMPIGEPIEPAIYFTARQFPFRTMNVVVWGRDAATERAALVDAMRAVAPGVPLGAVETWDAHFRSLSAEPRLLMTVLVFFSALAAVLAAIGVYGLFAWSVAMRTRELAIRLTLGAKPTEIGGLILRQSAMLVAVGLAGGWIVVRLGERTISTVLFDVHATDLVSTATAFSILLAAAMTACLVPALRAARLDPNAALRSD